MPPKMPDWVYKTIFYSNKYGIAAAMQTMANGWQVWLAIFFAIKSLKEINTELQSVKKIPYLFE